LAIELLTPIRHIKLSGLLPYYHRPSFWQIVLPNSAALTGTGHVLTVPAVQEESDFSAKRSGAAMYTACFRLEDYLGRDAATVAAGPDVIR
jgi:hypothetical protein